MSPVFRGIRYFLLFLGSVGYFIATRYFLDDDSFMTYIVASYICLLFSFVPLIKDFIHDTRSNFDEHKKIVASVFIMQALICCGIVLSHVYLKNNLAATDGYLSRVVLSGWVSLLVLGFIGFLGVEIGAHSSGDGPLADSRLVYRNLARWLNVGLLLLSLSAINYVGVETDKMVDLSYLKVTHPSNGTVQIIENLSKPLTIEVYFPYDNEVLPNVKIYLDKLPTDRVKVQYLDKDLNPKEAEKSKVSRNGQLVLRVADKMERINIGNTAKKAKKVLKKLDQNFQKSLQKLSTTSKIVYFTRDHGEMDPNRSTSDLRRLKRAESLLKSQNFVPKVLDAKNGLFQKVPSDASVVIIAAPTLPFSSQEIQVLLEYLNGGGSILLAVDQEFEDATVEKSSEGLGLRTMSESLGVKILDGRVANDKKYVTATRTKADRWFLVTNIFGSHPSVESLSKHDNKLRILARNAEALEVKKVDGWRADELVKTFGDSYLDINLNSKFDKGSEKKKVYPLSVAVERLGAASGKGGRMIVLSDGTMIGDLLLNNNPGNQVMFLDTVRWLTGDESIVSSQSSEEDVHITHAKNEHLVIFYASVVIVPCSVLLLGFFATRRRSTIAGGSSDA